MSDISKPGYNPNTGEQIMATANWFCLSVIALLFATINDAGAGNAADECTASARASFDCTKAESATERTICENPQAALSDCLLGKIYQDAMNSASKLGTSEVVLAEQRSWIQDRDSRCSQVNESIRTSCVIYQSEERSWHLIRKFGLVSTNYGFADTTSGAESADEAPAEGAIPSEVSPATSDLQAEGNEENFPTVAEPAPTAEGEQLAPAEATTTDQAPPDIEAETQPGPEGNSGSSLLAVFGLLAILFILFYFLPTIIAFNRRHPNRWVIFLINFVFGATLIGWVISLIWALRAIHISPGVTRSNGSNGGESGLNIFVNDEKRVRLVSNVSGAQQSNAANELMQAFELLRAGAITESEFSALKTKILGRPQIGEKNLQEQLQRLADLKNSGAISSAEYAALKKTLISETQLD